MALVSIIMPVRNAMPYLGPCLDSILQQSYENWELIAVNDQSTDLSHAVLLAYASKDHRIQCVQNHGSGIIDALSTGYALAKGDFVTRMDADDLMPRIKLERLIEGLWNSGKGHLATGKVKYISESVLGDGFKKYERWLNRLCVENRHYSEIYKECVIPSPCWMMYKEDFESIGGFKSETYPEDYDLCFRMYEHQIRVIPCSEILHIWRDHNQRASRNDDNYSDNRFLDMKVRYFLKIDHRRGERLILWGAGRKGKRIAQLLIKNAVKFDWMTNNEKKIGKDIYSQKIQDSSIVKDLSGKSSILLAVANEAQQEQILKSLSLTDKNKKLFKFC